MGLLDVFNCFTFGLLDFGTFFDFSTLGLLDCLPFGLLDFGTFGLGIIDHSERQRPFLPIENAKRSF